MLTNSLVPETFFCSGSGIDKRTGNPFVMVHRSKDGIPHTWRIERTLNSNGRRDWRHVESMFSNGEREDFRGRVGAGRNLSCSKLDLVLRAMAEEHAIQA